MLSKGRRARCWATRPTSMPGWPFPLPGGLRFPTWLLPSFWLHGEHFTAEFDSLPLSCQVYNSETRPQEDLNLNTNQKGVAYIIKCPTTEVALGPCGDCYGTRLECPPGSNGISSKASSDLPPLLTHPEQPIFGPGTHPTISNPIEAPHYESDFLQHPPHSSIFQHGGDSKDENGILRLRHTSGDQTCSNRPELNPNSQSLVFKSQERKLQRSLSRPGEITILGSEHCFVSMKL